MHYCCSNTIYGNFSHHLDYVFIVRSKILCTGWRWWYSVGARSCFRWKLHPSSQAWPLLSPSNRGETAIAKCGNWGTNSNLNQCWFMNWTKYNEISIQIQIFWFKVMRYIYHINGLVKERQNSVAHALKLCLSCINPLIRYINQYTPAI